MTVEIVKLTHNQQKAVDWIKGHVLVRAGPGSGKTKLIAYKIAKIIESTEDYSILGLTFTDKAAMEMKNRVSSITPDLDERIDIATFHSFCASLLHQHGHLLGIRPDFAILAETEQADVVQEAITASGIQYQDDTTRKQFLYIIHRLLQEGISVEDAQSRLESEGISDAKIKCAVYGHYRKLMIKNNTIDYDGVLAEALKLLTSTPVGALIQRIYRYVCVDEFQDTNTIQYQILCHIVDHVNGNLFVVADDNQAIYGWNGANLEILKQISKKFNMKIFNLPENFRCPPSVVDIANNLIATNSNCDYTEVTSKYTDDVIRVKSFETEKEQARWVANDIAQRPANEHAGCAILARRRATLDAIVDNLNDRGIPSQIITRKDEFISNPMIWLHGMLQLANARQSRTYLSKVCRSFYSLTGTSMNIDAIVSDAMADGDDDYLRAWTEVARNSHTSNTTRLFLTNISNSLVDRLDADEFIKESFKWFENPSDNLMVSSIVEYKEEKEIFNKIILESDDQVVSAHITVGAVLRNLQQSSKEQYIPEGTVLGYTIHTSKGMEFDHVYLVGLVEDELPSWYAINKGDDSVEMQEERRICFVAITRTQKTLTMTYSLMISEYHKKPSRFLKEMGIDTC